jgi:hypothetical protein
MRYKLRTLLILLAVGPPVVAGMWLTVRVISKSSSSLWDGPYLESAILIVFILMMAIKRA